MLFGTQNPSGRFVRVAIRCACLVVVMSLVACVAAVAASSRTRSRFSDHPGLPKRTQSELRREITEHQRSDALLRSARSRRLTRAAVDQSSGAWFQRGDVFFAAGDGVREYSPSGELQRTISGTSGATTLCFDPSGAHLIVPGVGLFGRAGRLLPSNWASITIGSHRCVADGFGHVYVSAGSGGLPYSITQYNISGKVLQTFKISEPEDHVLAIDLAPDECTIYYGSWAGDPTRYISRLNVCTNSSEPPFQRDEFADDLRVLPNWEVLKTDDPFALLYDASGADVMGYAPGGPGLNNTDSLRTMSLDPDGRSFWVCCAGVPPDETLARVFRFDISSGQLLTSWGTGHLGLTPMAVYGPPLLGNANVKATIGSNTAGTAEAFSTHAGYSGRVTRLRLYLDSSSTASQAIVGIYSNDHGHPGALREQATISNLRPASWNYADIPSMPVTAGKRYWIAVLGPKGGGKISFRDAWRGGTSETAAQRNLSVLPAHWSGAAHAGTAGPPSAYGS